MTDLIPTIEIVSDRPVVSSLKVAEQFGKAHYNVVRDIKKIIAEVSEEFAALNFEGCDYVGDNGKQLPMFWLTKDGFTILAMGYTGKEVMRLKEAYIRRFNAMEAELRGRALPAPTAPTHARAGRFVHAGQAVVPGAILVEALGADADCLTKEQRAANFIEGAHYFALSGEALERLLATASLGGASMFLGGGRFLFWTQRGVTHLADFLATDQAWAALAWVEREYFGQPSAPSTPQPTQTMSGPSRPDLASAIAQPWERGTLSTLVDELHKVTRQDRQVFWRMLHARLQIVGVKHLRRSMLPEAEEFLRGKLAEAQGQPTPQTKAMQRADHAADSTRPERLRPLEIAVRQYVIQSGRPEVDVWAMAAAHGNVTRPEDIEDEDLMDVVDWIQDLTETLVQLNASLANRVSKAAPMADAPRSEARPDADEPGKDAHTKDERARKIERITEAAGGLMRTTLRRLQEFGASEDMQAHAMEHITRNALASIAAVLRHASA